MHRSFMTVQKASPVTYQLIGHLKTFLVLTLSALIFGDEFGMHRLVGYLVTFCGLGWYTREKMNPTPAPAIEEKNKVDDEKESKV